MYLNNSTLGLPPGVAQCPSGKKPKARLLLFLSLFITLGLLTGLLSSTATASVSPLTEQRQINANPTVPASDSLALVALYNSTNGAGWTTKTNWLTGPVNTWYGVTVTNGRVARLNLFENQLMGSLPASLGNLLALQDLTLSSNQLSGNIPTSLGNLDTLRILDLQYNQLTGSFPVSLCNLPTLQYISLGFNQLSGNIPDEFGNKSPLVDLSLHNNQLSGSIPASLGNLSALTGLYLSSNHLSGSVPASLGNLPLQSVNLYGNQFTSLPVFNSNIYFGLVVSANNLTFESLEPNLINLTNDGNNHYSPQDSVLVGGNYSINDGQLVQLSALVGGAHNLYQWTRNGYNITGATNATLTATEAGAYSCKISNTVVTGLTLHRRRVNVEVILGTRTVIPSDSLALVDLYNSTNGAGWLYNSNWLTGPVNTWGGVTVAGGRVTALALTQNYLSGSIPATLGNLTALQQLNLGSPSGSWSSNQLSGSIPASLGNLTALTFLSLGDNQLTGSIPAGLGNLTALTYLNLNQNQLTGSIPAGLGNLTALTHLGLYNNQLTGIIPNEIDNLKALGTLALANNQLSGSIPASVGNLTALTFLWLGDNQLSGSVPNEIGNLTALQNLSLENNQLSGSIPASLGNLPELVSVYLYKNQFTSLPPFTAGLSYGLSVNQNRLTFESLEANISKLTSAFDYSPQDSVLVGGNESLSAGASLQLSALVGGANNRYQWTKNGLDIAGATQATLTVTEAGAYSCKITNTVVAGLTLHRRQVKVSVNNTPVCQATGTILREVWTNVIGSHTTNIPLLSTPNQSSQLTSLQAPANFGDRYGQRLRGYICAPQTGAYTFWIVSDNDAQLYLSTDADPANKQAIAFIQNGNAYPGQWTKYASQKSATIQLVAGQRYYLEAIHKEEYGGDNLIIGWRTPASAANATPVVVPGSVLSPFIPTTCTATGTILREYWANVTGTSVAAIPVNTPPTSTSQMASFQGPLPAAGQYGVGDNYGTRYRGYVCAPSTGNYTFWLASDNDGELWLSTDNNPNNKVKLAYIQNGFVYANQWTKYPSQQSVVISLVAGKAYYIEALQKEASGGDQLQVGWRLPTSAANASPVVIPGSVLSPFVPASAARYAAENFTETTSPRMKVFPNPSNGKVFIDFTTTASEYASLNMYNMWGGLVQPLFEGTVEAGVENRVEMDGQQFATGIYVIRLTTPNKVDFKKIILMK